ncbi:MAG TPA: PHP domain-containing protein, partial [Bacteroidia bacterium]|nr:PHP domain-containing protein [Bacteroidia bacterium]
MLLNCHTYYSFGYGTFSPEELLALVKTRGYSTFALTDINNTSAVFDTIRLSKEYGIKPVIGIDFRTGAKQHFVGLAKNNEGFYELNEHLSSILHHPDQFENSKIRKLEDSPSSNGYQYSNLRIFQSSNVFIVYPLSNYRGQPLSENEFIGVSIKDLPSLPFNPFVAPLLRRGGAYASARGGGEVRLVCLQTLSFENKRHFNAHRLLRAIDKNTLLSKLPPEEQGTIHEMPVSHADMRLAYAMYPEIIYNTERILEECNVDFEFGKFANKNLKHFTGTRDGDMQLLRDECAKYLPYRYPEITNTVVDRLEKELDVIDQMGFASYFLINWDLVNYARHKNYYYVGRGSGANSMVAYLLRITDVDPIDLDLYFERFINPFRTTPPDFDIDFSWTDRDDITEYIFKKYDKGRAALLGSYATYQHDAVTRELGKVFGLPPGEIDRLQRA